MLDTIIIQALSHLLTQRRIIDSKPVVDHLGDQNAFQSRMIQILIGDVIVVRLDHTG